MHEKIHTSEVIIVSDSILSSIKKLLGIAEEHEQFDLDIIIHINSVFMILSQLGLEEFDRATISSKDDKWSDYVDIGILESIKSYVYLKVRIIFDPPTSSIVMETLKVMISELEWRLNLEVEQRKNKSK